jgi:membrane protein
LEIRQDLSNRAACRRSADGKEFGVRKIDTVEPGPERAGTDPPARGGDDRGPEQRIRGRDFALQLAGSAISEFRNDRCSLYASSIAYHVLFSIFPLTIFLAAVFGIVVRATGTRADAVDTIVQHVPVSASGESSLRQLLEGATGNLSTLGLLGLVGVVYGASGMMGSLRQALNAVWDVSETRPYLKGKLIDVGLVVAAAALALASFGITVAVRVADAAASGSPAGFASGAVGWLLAVVVPLATAFAVVLFLYRVVPAAAVSLGEAWPGALIAACAFVLLENLFAVYVQHFGHYNAVYGSVGAVIAFMVFVYFSSLAFLLGAEVASEWPRVREHVAPGPTEEGPPFTTKVAQAVKGLWVRQPSRDGHDDRGS